MTINVVAFTAFAWDKHRARTNRWRIQESTLLTIAAIGGIVGAITTQHWMRHKTRKEPFRTNLYMIAGAHLAILVMMLIPAVRGAILSAIS
ncbi:hypothetical protein BB934_02990 [Microvirga ossetica]|uniref:DUF1294 domain-containing protein n=1 Tax=Microvirga ossetica TaxID=1882682 RepID=A0A1B2ENK2_9HYPH|nr:DUF1294 domain-containing protein [Microvirga ossetica]ANY81554.1 hypothetical protein BB934_02990 [Microvirga ossetica]